MRRREAELLRENARLAGASLSPRCAAHCELHCWGPTARAVSGADDSHGVWGWAAAERGAALEGDLRRLQGDERQMGDEVSRLHALERHLGEQVASLGAREAQLNHQVRPLPTEDAFGWCVQ